MIWAAEGQSAWTSKMKPGDPFIEIRNKGNAVERITIRPYPSNYSEQVDYVFRVRLRFDSHGVHTLPANAAVWVTNKTVDQSGLYKQVSSDEAAEEGEEKEEGGDPSE